MRPGTGPTAEAAAVAWVQAVLQHAALHAAREAQRRNRRELVSGDVGELAGPGRDPYEEVVGRLDADALCARFTGREGDACRLLAAHGSLSERDLGRRLGVSQPTAHRLKHALAAALEPLIQP